MSPMQDAPMLRNDVPWNAVKIRKTKYDARFGESAVPREQPQKRAAVTTQI